MLDARNHQGKFGEDYVRVLASAAGLIVLTHDLDVDGIDLSLRRPGRFSGVSSPLIDVQVKSWSTPRRSPNGENWKYDGLNQVQFNKLAGDDFLVPRFLFLIVVPKDAREYVQFTPGDMRLRHLGYFLSLRQESRVDRPIGDRRHPVEVPLGNVLTVHSLLRLIEPDHREPDQRGPDQRGPEQRGEAIG
jgi:hypothetical protein